MISKILVESKVFDARALTKKNKLKNIGFIEIKDVKLVDVYTIDKKFPPKDLQKIASALSNPVTQTVNILSDQTALFRNVKQDSNISGFNWVIEIGFLPGVTDNIANTAKEIVEDLLKLKFTDGEDIYTSQIIFLKGKISDHEIKDITGNLYNPLIQRADIKSYRDYLNNKSDFFIPKVLLHDAIKVSKIDLEIDDEELSKIGKSGIKNSDNTRRGPLALSLASLKTIRNYFRKIGRSPTDIELESIAQTWSEHCKHTIFANPIDEIKDGFFNHYIKRATEEIRKKKGKNDFCVSVFADNSGAIVFDHKNLITHKVETHNSPSALDPFGGSITGIVGVNRDTIGFGLGAKPVANFYGFCFADPRIDISLYKDSSLSQKMLSSRRIMDGVIEGVNAGGNQSGIPTPSGFIYFDERYRGKPLVFVGTVGVIPKKIKNKLSYIKKAKTGDYIVMIGGRVGKDGIHGATFSSEALDSGSPATAVQIGDPITQKKLSDALVKEAREQLLYNSITDNGAGGLSCSVAEMAKESGGCKVDLDKVPLKYQGLNPWEIWISEAQERMTLAVPKKKWKIFRDLALRRGVEATVIGEFTDSDRCTVSYNGRIIMDIDMEFLHYGLPKQQLYSTYQRSKNEEPSITLKKDLTKDLTRLLERLNIASFEFISQQYDYIVQGNSVLGPLSGRGRINANTAVVRPILESQKGIVLSNGLYPSYSDIDPYHMAACSLDTAVRNIVVAGADPERIALLDNFCWCESEKPERLGQLKRAVKACHDLAVYYKTPFISGKDSMFNDFKGFGSEGKPLQISIPPTLLISSIGIIDDVYNSISPDLKIAGDLIYILGSTYNELGGSEYIKMYSEKKGKEYIGNFVPKVDAQRNIKLYKSYQGCVEENLISSAISIGRGGLAVALTKKAMGGLLGVNISLDGLPGETSRDDFTLFSESQGRILCSVNPENRDAFEKMMKGNSFKQIGDVTDKQLILIKGRGGLQIVNCTVNEALNHYRKTFAGY